MADARAKTGRPSRSEFADFEAYLRDYGTTAQILRAARSLSEVVEDLSQPADSPLAYGAVIDGTELLLGFVAVGMEVAGRESSAAWVVEWLRQHKFAPERLLEQRRALLAESSISQTATTAIPSQALTERVLPAAVDLAKRTVDRDRADARHLLWALLDQPLSGPLAEILDAGSVRDAKRYIVARLEKSHEEGEKLEVWRALAEVDEPSPPADAPAPPTETVGTLSDAPALVDALGRQAFAEVLATRVKQVSKTLRSGTLGGDSAFILHVDGPWGSGKTSILNFLKENLEQSDPPWMIVEFNAWQNQQRTPAWWPIISHVGSAAAKLSWLQFPRARWAWLLWNMKLRWVPILLTTLLTTVFLYFAWNAVTGDKPSGLFGVMKDMVAGVLAIGTLVGLAWTTSRTVFFGSKSAAEAYVKSTAEPFRPIIDLYERLIRTIERPIAVFIDDIDRCDSSYVIELLEGVQTLLRSAPVVYVVAGDRKWICSSFEKRYADFGGQIGMPGRPLGYLFLDKVFQLSTAIPRLSTVRQAAYWKRLLSTGDQGAATAGIDVRTLEAKAEKDLEGKSSHEEIQQQIDQTEEGSLEREAVRAAAAKQTTSREAIRAAEHRLEPLARLLEPNPRSMKRLVNAYGLNQARVFLEGRKVEVEALARWTIIELRWPILADYLATNWTDIAAGNLSFAQFPELIRTLLGDLDVKEVFGVVERPENVGESGKQLGMLTIQCLGPILE
jgi:hypothetical protein